LWRVILLPLNIANRLSREELRALLAHELGHHARGDVWWLWLGRGLCHLLPIQPLYLWAVREWHRAAEPLCDDWAVEQSVSPVALAKSLTQVAGWCVAKPAIGPAATNGLSQLTHRVERLLNHSAKAASSRNGRMMVMLIPLLAVIALAFAPLVSWPQADDPPQFESSPVTENPNATTPAILSSVEQKPTKPSPVLESPDSIPEDVRQDLEAVQRDLERAMKLLQETEDDPEIRDAVQQLQERLQRLQNQDAQFMDAVSPHSF
jgi:hypothetical protein